MEILRLVKKYAKGENIRQKENPFTTNFNFYKSAIYPGYNPGRSISK
jgi:hypothetical protein